MKQLYTAEVALRDENGWDSRENLQWCWQIPVEKIGLSSLDVHLWKVALEVDDNACRNLVALLSPRERQQAERFRFARDWRRFVVAQGMLRKVLSRYLPLDPKQLVFEYGAQGKPSLMPGQATQTVEFNLTHSGELALIAVAYDRRVGVDIERLSRNVEIRKLAERFFATEEAAYITALDGSLQRSAFFRCWTAKEAYLKALGVGITVPLASVEVLDVCDKLATWIVYGNPEKSLDLWSIATFGADQDYLAALAVEGTPPCLLCWEAQALTR